jgi:diguanylate cyclase (GGDEF)-like protein
MSTPSTASLINRTGASIDWLFDKISYHVVPVLALFVSVTALIIADSHFKNPTGTALEMQVQLNAPASWTPQEARDQLAAKSAVSQVETKLSEKPLWFMIKPLEMAEHSFIEFPSRHARSIRCWDSSLTEVGSATRHGHTGAITPVKAGFALELPRVNAGDTVLCQGTFVGPAHPSAAHFTASELHRAVNMDHRKWGMLDGGMLVLAVFVAIVALLSKESLYMLFAGWIVLNLRVAELSAGWDMQWLGHEIPIDAMNHVRAITIALFVIVTGQLYRTLFNNALEHGRSAKAVEWSSRLTFFLLPAAILLPFANYLPVMWVVSLIGFAALSANLAITLFRRLNSVALWFAAAFSATLLSNVAEVIAAAASNVQLAGTINAVTGAIASTVFIAVAIAERIKQEHLQFVRATEELEHSYDANPIGLFTVDTTGGLISANPATYEILGKKNEDATNWWLGHFDVSTWTMLHERLLNGPEAEIEFKSNNKGQEQHLLVKARLINDKIEGFLQDITAKTLMTQNLYFMAHNDPLTKALNRRGIELAFEDAIAGLGKDETLAVAFMDLDRFKLINDLFGHASGDDILCQVADRAKEVLGTEHVIGRVGGDEFLIIMPRATLTFAKVISHAVVSVVSQRSYHVGDKSFNVHASIGLIECSPDMELKDVIASASRACQQAKKDGDGVVVYERSSSALFERRAELALADQLSSDDATLFFFLEMQPIMSLRRPGASLDFEVLLRMRGRDGSIIPAGRIIGVAEKGGLMGMIDRWVLETTLKWIETNAEKLTQTRFVCMNLSGASLNDESFIDDALELLERYRTAAKRICLEITESVALHDLTNTVRFIDQVRNFGVRVALDDFGAGYTSFTYLKDLPADVLKIDGNFICKINENPANVAIVEAIVRLAMNLGMKTIAEWAEDAATVKTLASIGVDYVQGFAIARSQQPDAILLASSAADFIKDGTVKEVVSNLANYQAGALQSNVFSIQDLLDQR